MFAFLHHSGGVGAAGQHRIDLLLPKDQLAIGADPPLSPTIFGAGRKLGFAWSMWLNVSTDVTPWNEMTIFRGIMDWPANPWVQSQGTGGVLFQFGLKANHSFTFRYDSCVYNSPAQPHLKPWQWNHVGVQLTQLGEISVYWNGRLAAGPAQCGKPLVDYSEFSPQWKVSPDPGTGRAMRMQIITRPRSLCHFPLIVPFLFCFCFLFFVVCVCSCCASVPTLWAFNTKKMQIGGQSE